VAFTKQIIYKSEAYQIVGACMEVYNHLGYGFLEVVYKDAMEIEFLQQHMNYIREDEHAIDYKGATLKHKFFADYTLFNNIIIEVKSNKEGITDEAIAQTLNYLKASGLRLGLIINFGKSSLEYKRLIF
jgi:GxxExxY protein